MNRQMLQVLWIFLIFSSCATPLKRDFSLEEIVYPENLQVQARSAWGWKSSSKTRDIQQIQKVTICQSGIQIVRGQEPITHFQQANSKSQLPYHFLIDVNGIIYEAQPPHYIVTTTSGFKPAGHIIICVMGNYETDILNQYQMKALVDLTAFLVAKYHIALYNIQGLNAYISISPVSNNLYQYLENGTLQARVQERLPR